MKKNLSMLQFTLILISFVILILSPSSLLFSQPEEVWVSRYNGVMSNRDIARAIAIDHLGNVYVTGVSRENSMTGHMTTIKYNPDGVMEWIDSFAPTSGSGNINTGVAISIQPPELGGNIFVGGTVMSLEGDFAIAKYSPNGVRQWVTTYTGLFVGGPDYLVDIAADPLGGVYAYGGVELGTGTLYDLSTVRFDSNGTLLWEKIYNGQYGSETDIPAAMALDNLGRVYVVAQTFNHNGSLTFDYTTICYLPDGTEQWLVNYNGPGNGADKPIAMVIDNFQNQFITGWVTGSSGSKEFGTIMQNSFGTTLWAATYNGSAGGTDSAVAITIDESGNVFITGHSLEMHDGNMVESMTTISYDTLGNERWIRHYFGIDSTGANPSCIQVDNLGGVYVGGSTKVTSQPGHDYVVVKYDTYGLEQWVVSYNGTGNNDDQLFALALDHKANIYVTGKSFGAGTLEDYTTIRYTQTISGISPTNNYQPDAFTLYQNYPNPFNPSTSIKFEVKNSSFVTIKIYDVKGNELITLVNETLTSGTKVINWNGKDNDGVTVPSGVYFYQLSAEGFTDSKRMILLK